MHVDKAKWGRRTIRAVAIMNVFFAVVGVYLVAGTAVSVLRARANTLEARYVRGAYYIMTLIDLACLFMLAVGAIYLWRLSRRGLHICNLVFSFEIAYFLGSAALALFLAMGTGWWALLGKSIAAASGIGRVGTAPQILIAYPVLALIVLNTARASLPSHAPQR